MATRPVSIRRFPLPQGTIRVYPVLGAKFTGQSKGCHNTETGEYWEVLPPLDRDAIRFQRMLLQKRR